MSQESRRAALDAAVAVLDERGLPGFSVDFLAVKAGDEFFIYQLDGSSSGTFTTAGLDNDRGQARNLSHLAFFGTRNASAVPEPGTWAMMLMGFGAVGFAMRRTRVRKLLPQAA